MAIMTFWRNSHIWKYQKEVEIIRNMCGFIYSMNERLQIKNQSKDYLFLLDLIKSTVPRKKRFFIDPIIYIRK